MNLIFKLFYFNIVPILSQRGIQVFRFREKYVNSASPKIKFSGTNPQYLESTTGYFDPSQFNPTIEIGDWDYGDIESALGFTNIFDPESLAATLSQLGGIDPNTGDPIRAGEVKALTPEMIDKTTSAYYSPYEEAERETLVEKLGKARGQAQTGGFAGSGGRQAGLSGAERLYRGGYEDLLANIMKMRGSATGDVLDTIYGWQELISDQ